MKRSANAVLAIAAMLMLAACGGQSAKGPDAGGSADLPPRLQQSGTSESALPPYSAKGGATNEPLLSDAPVLNPDEPGTGARDPNAKPGAGPMASTRGAQPGARDANGPQVAALIPNRGPYTPVHELGRIHFGFDSDDLTPQAKRMLDRNLQWLLAHPEVRVRVEGHCDERGSNEYNLGLGQRRADRVVNHLTSQGATARNLLAVSFGEEVPIAPGHDESAWSQNRRVDFSYLDDNVTGQVTSSQALPAAR